MGGREEVLNAPLIEVFKYMDMVLEEEEALAEKERTKYYMDFLVTRYAQLPQGEESAEVRQARDGFLETIRPKPDKPLVSKKGGWGDAVEQAALEYEKNKKEDGD